MELIFVWIFTASTISFVLFGIDKRKAKHQELRIPESVLFGVAVLGGGLGALLGMQLFRHKTRHLKFLLGIPLCVLLNGIIASFFYQYLL